MEKKTYLCYSGEDEIFLEVAKDTLMDLAFFKLYKKDLENGNLSIIYKDFVFIDQDDEVLEILDYCEYALKQKIYYELQISQEGFEYLKSDK